MRAGGPLRPSRPDGVVATQVAEDVEVDSWAVTLRWDLSSIDPSGPADHPRSRSDRDVCLYVHSGEFLTDGIVVAIAPGTNDLSIPLRRASIPRLSLSENGVPIPWPGLLRSSIPVVDDAGRSMVGRVWFGSDELSFMLDGAGQPTTRIEAVAHGRRRIDPVVLEVGPDREVRRTAARIRSRAIEYIDGLH